MMKELHLSWCCLGDENGGRRRQEEQDEKDNHKEHSNKEEAPDQTFLESRAGRLMHCCCCRGGCWEACCWRCLTQISLLYACQAMQKRPRGRPGKVGSDAKLNHEVGCTPQRGQSQAGHWGDFKLDIKNSAFGIGECHGEGEGPSWCDLQPVPPGWQWQQWGFRGVLWRVTVLLPLPMVTWVIEGGDNLQRDLELSRAEVPLCRRDASPARTEGSQHDRNHSRTAEGSCRGVHERPLHRLVPDVSMLLMPNMVAHRGAGWVKGVRWEPKPKGPKTLRALQSVFKHSMVIYPLSFPRPSTKASVNAAGMGTRQELVSERMLKRKLGIWQAIRQCCPNKAWSETK